MKKLIKALCLFTGLSLCFSSHAMLDLDMKEGSFEDHLKKSKEYGGSSDLKKCQLDCWLKFKASLNKESQRYSKVRYKTRSQTKKHKEIVDGLRNGKNECVMSCN